jgi:hypothetical protein
MFLFLKKLLAGKGKKGTKKLFGGSFAASRLFFAAFLRIFLFFCGFFAFLCL